MGQCQHSTSSQDAQQILSSGCKATSEAASLAASSSASTSKAPALANTLPSEPSTLTTALLALSGILSVRRGAAYEGNKCESNTGAGRSRDAVQSGSVHSLSSISKSGTR